MRYRRAGVLVGALLAAMACAARSSADTAAPSDDTGEGRPAPVQAEAAGSQAQASGAAKEDPTPEEAPAPRPPGGSLVPT